MKTFLHSYNTIISVDNLLAAWREFVRGKKDKPDVKKFSSHLMDNILTLHKELKNKTYQHGGYRAFSISDPKPRNIHKASVRDRLLHHAAHRILYLALNRKFIYHTYSCRFGKGTHRALNVFRRAGAKVSKNNTRTCWVLKCDIKKFFANIDHKILLSILQKHIDDSDTIWLLENIIKSFSTSPGKGLPLGNLTSQLLVNVYMNEFDQFAKHKLKARHYIRYADDFVLLHHDKEWLEHQVPKIEGFLWKKLKLAMHPDKVYIKTLASGVDFLGWVHFPNHRVLRTATKRRMLRRIYENPSEKTVQSYLGLISHGNTNKLVRRIEDLYFEEHITSKFL